MKIYVFMFKTKNNLLKYNIEIRYKKLKAKYKIKY